MTPRKKAAPEASASSGKPKRKQTAAKSAAKPSARKAARVRPAAKKKAAATAPSKRVATPKKPAAKKPAAKKAAKSASTTTRHPKRETPSKPVKKTTKPTTSAASKAKKTTSAKTAAPKASKATRKAAKTPAKPKALKATKAAAPKAPKAVKSTPKSAKVVEAAPAKKEGAGKLSALAAVRKASARKAQTPVAAKAAAKPAASAKPKKGKRSTAKAEAPKKTRQEILARILSMRANDTRKGAEAAAQQARQVSSTTRVPTSVAKAKELAESRRSGRVEKVAAPKKILKEAVPKRKRRKAPYSKTELRELREILSQERERLVRDLAMINDLATSSEESMSRSFSNHQADAATDSSALETTFMTRRYEEERLSQVLNAIERLEEGTYGLCEMCAEDPLQQCDSCPYIPIGRLRAKPFARLCVPCREKLEKSKG
ncbi:MAG: hypothetical protein PWP23_3273 [Candidatus Sumerlaeota bacterium]|nr:hypothetical protein [Candidatus Sumerlaeota bacterium]